MEILDKLSELELVMPEASQPGGNYASVNVRGKLAYVAIQFPIFNQEYRYQGRLGAELTTSNGYQAMQLCALNVIAQIKAKVGLANIEGLNHIDAYYQCADNWDEAPLVVNGASDLFVKLLGEKGHHSRSIIGVHKLPRNFCAGLSCTFTLC